MSGYWPIGRWYLLVHSAYCAHAHKLHTHRMKPIDAKTKAKQKKNNKKNKEKKNNSNGRYVLLIDHIVQNKQTNYICFFCLLLRAIIIIFLFHRYKKWNAQSWCIQYTRYNNWHAPLRPQNEVTSLKKNDRSRKTHPSQLSHVFFFFIRIGQQGIKVMTLIIYLRFFFVFHLLANQFFLFV